MFGLDTLDVAIGMALLYLLVSLMCTAAVEMLEARLKTRSEDLEQGLRDLLRDPQGNGLVAQVYKHPLIFGLYQGDYSPSKDPGRLWWLKLARLLPWKPSPSLPAYIPADVFASAILDLAGGVSANGGTKSLLERALEWAKTPAADSGQGAHGGGAGEAPSGTPNTGTGSRATASRLDLVGHAFSTGKSLQASGPAQTGDNYLKVIVRNAIERALSAKGGVAEAEANLKAWFDGGMDRVSGWYKRRTQLVLFIMGLAIAAGFNIDSLTIMQRLQNDDALRAAAVKFAETAPDPAAPKMGMGGDTSAAGGAAPLSPSIENAKTAAAAGSEGVASTDEKKPASPTNKPTAKGALGSNTLVSTGGPSKSLAEQKFHQASLNLARIGYPIGWNWQDWKPVIMFNLPAAAPIPQAEAACLRNSTSCPGGRTTGSPTAREFMSAGDWFSMFAGWLMTALAVTLGAPFWFDVLNKFMVIRSTVKPAEKSPPEASEDRQRPKGQQLKIQVAGVDR